MPLDLHRLLCLAHPTKRTPVLNTRVASHVSDRRNSVRTPIRTKPRTTRSAQRAGDVYNVRTHPENVCVTPNKITHRSIGEGWSCAEGRDGDRVKARRRNRSCAMVERFSHACRYEKEGKINNSPIDKLAKQILQSTLTINKIK